MSILRKCGHGILSRFVETMASSIRQSSYFMEPLTARSLIRVEGEEVGPFLQGLITNDMKHLAGENPSQSMYAMFLNKSGRVLYDSIIYRTPSPNMFIIECDKEISNELRRHLRLYRVRRKIDIVCIRSDFMPWILFQNETNNENDSNNNLEWKLRSNFIYCPDPRFKNLGLRIIIPQDYQLQEINSTLSENITLDSPPSSNNYHARRYKFGIGEGIIDHPPGKAFPLESNCDFLHGVSFHKGCYIGQELTARVHHTGITRKRLLPLTLTASPSETALNVQSQSGCVIGTIRGVYQERALALLRIEQAFLMQNLEVDGDRCTVEKPEWWPKVLPTKAVLRREN